MGNDMFNEEQLAYAAGQQASREHNSPPAYILSREAFLRRLHILADTRPSNDGLIPSEVDLSAHDAALRAENERLREALRDGMTHLLKMKDGAHNCLRCGMLYEEWRAALAAPQEEKP